MYCALLAPTSTPLFQLVIYLWWTPSAARCVGSVRRSVPRITCTNQHSSIPISYLPLMNSQCSTLCRVCKAQCAAHGSHQPALLHSHQQSHTPHILAAQKAKLMRRIFCTGEGEDWRHNELDCASVKEESSQKVSTSDRKWDKHQIRPYERPVLYCSTKMKGTLILCHFFTRPGIRVRPWGLAWKIG